MNNTILLLKMKYCFPIIKQVRKIYELGLRFLTKIKVSFKDDPSFLLVNCRTKNQEIAYEMLKNRELHGLNSTHTNGSIKLTIIILFRDKINLTIACLNSLVIQYLNGIELQIILIDNGSVNLKIGDQLSELFFGNNNIAWKLKRVDEAFNFSKLNNVGVAESTEFDPKYFIFLNNDVVCLEKNTLIKIVAFKENMGPYVGAIGCTLLYPDCKIQHLFLAPGIKIVAGHPLKGVKYNSAMQWFKMPRPVPAVTGAFLFVSKRQFLEVGGFDEELGFAYQDLDLCLKIQSANHQYSNWALTDLICIHHENATRSKEHRWSEVEKIYRRWKNEINDNKDFSSVFSRESEFPTLKLFARVPRRSNFKL